MRITPYLLAALAVVGAAACADAPTAAVAPDEGARRSLTNQLPVPVITQVNSRLMVFGDGHSGRRYLLTAANSYDPDGYVTNYRWTSDCVYNPTVLGDVEYTLDVRTGDTCSAMLTVWDNDGGSDWTHNYY